MARESALSWGLEKLEEAAATLHGLIYEGERPPYELREDLDIDLRCELIGVLHDIQSGARKFHATERRSLAERPA